MNPDDSASNNDRMKAIAKKIRAGLARKGWTQARLEEEAGFAHGALSRILAARQQKVWPKTLNRIARALDVAPDELAEGISVGSGAGKALSELPGYADAEFQAARLDPWIPIEVFQAARQTRLTFPPQTVTVEFLREHVLFLAQHVFRVSKTSELRSRDPTVDEAVDKGSRRKRRS